MKEKVRELVEAILMIGYRRGHHSYFRYEQAKTLISPHIDSMTERIMGLLEPLPESKEQQEEKKTAEEIDTLDDFIMEVACDFAWENKLAKSEGYQKVRLLYSLWIQENMYYKKKKAEYAEQSLSSLRQKEKND